MFFVVFVTAKLLPKLLDTKFLRQKFFHEGLQTRLIFNMLHIVKM